MTGPEDRVGCYHKRLRQGGVCICEGRWGLGLGLGLGRPGAQMAAEAPVGTLVI